MKNELIIYSNLVNKDYVREIILEGKHIQRDMFGDVINKEEVKLAEYLFTLEDYINEKDSSGYVVKNKDPIFIKMWKWAYVSVGINSMYGSFKNMVYHHKDVKNTLRNKLIYDMVFRECYRRYNKEIYLPNTKSYLTELVGLYEGKEMNDAYTEMCYEIIPGERFPWLDAFFPRLWNKVYETESKA